eukprot:TRINITY_DN1918_c2_g1_i1.p1 TRINITY_DN1918_c2_g1~~TRINITY_DN1918_c2_g1_i1.p1  ORF type:complete len:1123 (+),score=256.59 TRINITY_DN1918_c2_g1_i1:88-3456(+)
MAWRAPAADRGVFPTAMGPRLSDLPGTLAATANAAAPTFSTGAGASSSSAGPMASASAVKTGGKTEQAKAELFQIIIDRSTDWRGRMFAQLGEVLKDVLIEDPDMFPWVKQAARRGLDHVWDDIIHEVERNIQVALAMQRKDANKEGPQGRWLLKLWYRLRAFLLYHFLPYNKSIFGRLKDPVYLVIYFATVMPVHGVRVVIYTILLFMLLVPGPPDEFQMINFILLAKGMQFFTSGILMMGSGALKYFVCFSYCKDDLLECMNNNGPSSPGTLGAVLDFFGTVTLTTIAFFALQYSRRFEDELVRQAAVEKEKKRQTKNVNRMVPVSAQRPAAADAEEVPASRGGGGRLAKLLWYDMKCLVFSLLVLALLSISNIGYDVVKVGYLMDIPQFRSNTYWCTVLYSILSFPFAVFMIPGLQNVLTHSNPTGFNEQGACVAFQLRTADPRVALDAAEEDREEKRPENVGLNRAVRMVLQVVRTVDEGMALRGASEASTYRFGDFTRGLWSRATKPTPPTANPLGDARFPAGEAPRPYVYGSKGALARGKPTQAMIEEALLEQTRRLHIYAVSVTEAREFDGRTRFRIEVLPNCTLDGTVGESEWSVWRRYGEFRDFYLRIGGRSKYWQDAPFPSRAVWTQCSGDRLEERRRALDVWLQRVLRDPAAQAEWYQPLIDFLSETTTMSGRGDEGEEGEQDEDLERGVAGHPDEQGESFISTGSGIGIVSSGAGVRAHVSSRAGGLAEPLLSSEALAEEDVEAASTLSMTSSASFAERTQRTAAKLNAFAEKVKSAGKRARGGAAEDAYKFGDLSRGLVARLDAKFKKHQGRPSSVQEATEDHAGEIEEHDRIPEDVAASDPRRPQASLSSSSVVQRDSAEQQQLQQQQRRRHGRQQQRHEGDMSQGSSAHSWASSATMPSSPPASPPLSFASGPQQAALPPQAQAAEPPRQQQQHQQLLEVAQQQRQQQQQPPRPQPPTATFEHPSAQRASVQMPPPGRERAATGPTPQRFGDAEAERKSAPPTPSLAPAAASPGMMPPAASAGQAEMLGAERRYTPAGVLRPPPPPSRTGSSGLPPMQAALSSRSQSGGAAAHPIDEQQQQQRFGARRSENNAASALGTRRGDGSQQ